MKNRNVHDNLWNLSLRFKLNCLSYQNNSVFSRMNNERFDSKSRNSLIAVNIKFDRIRRKSRCQNKYRIDKVVFVFAFTFAFKKSVTSKKKFVKTNSNVDDVIIIMINQSWFWIFFCAISEIFSISIHIFFDFYLSVLSVWNISDYDFFLKFSDFEIFCFFWNLNCFVFVKIL